MHSMYLYGYAIRLDIYMQTVGESSKGLSFTASLAVHSHRTFNMKC